MYRVRYVNITKLHFQHYIYFEMKKLIDRLKHFMYYKPNKQHFILTHVYTTDPNPLWYAHFLNDWVKLFARAICHICNMLAVKILPNDFLQQPVVCVSVFLFHFWLWIFMLEDAGKNENKSGTKIEFISVTGNRNALMWKKTPFQLFYSREEEKKRWKKNERKRIMFPLRIYLWLTVIPTIFRDFFFLLCSHSKYFRKVYFAKTTFIFITDKITVCLSKISFDLMFYSIHFIL